MGRLREDFESTKSQIDDSELVTQQEKVFKPNEVKADEDSSTPEEVVKELVSVKTAVLREILIDLNKISQKAFSPEVNLALYDDEPMKIAMERRNTGKQINTFVSMNFDFGKMTEEGLRVIGTEKLAPFDKIVLDAINSLYIEGHNEYISTQMVFHVITGDSERRITPKYAEEINNSFIKLLFTRIVIKANEKAIMYPALKDFSYHDTIVPGKMVKAKLNGTEVACIKVRATPPLYLYASKKKQISKVDIRLIGLPFAKETKETQEDITLLHYLLKRVVALKSISNYIKYETIYSELGYSKATKQKKLKIRKRIKEILESWKGSFFGDVEIIDFSELKDGQVPKEIVIKFKVHKDKKGENDE